MIDGAAIRSARLRAEIGVEELADALGVHDTTVWRWESGRTGRVDYSTASALAAVLGVSIDSLFIHAPDAATPDNGRGTDSAPPKVESAA